MLSQFDNRTKGLLFLLIFVVLGISYQILLQKQIGAEGVYIKGTVVNVEGRKNGIMITLRYKFRNKFYEGRMGGQFGKQDIGKQFFVQILPPNPADILLLDDKPVPECLTFFDAPLEGWQELPSCP